jgi:hypothetical protein
MMDDFDIQQDIHIGIPDHQILISFNNDDDAEKFAEWFNNIGSQLFVKWVEKYK